MNTKIKSNLFSFILWAFCLWFLYPFFLNPGLFLLPASSVPAVNSEEISFRIQLHGHISVMQSSLVKFLLPCLPTCSHSFSLALYLLLQLRDESTKVKNKAEKTNKAKTSSFITEISHFLKTHNGQQDGTSSTRSGQAVVLPLNIVLSSSTLWLRHFLSQRMCLQCLPSGQFVLLNCCFKTRKA